MDTGDFRERFSKEIGTVEPNVEYRKTKAEQK